MLARTILPSCQAHGNCPDDSSVHAQRGSVDEKLADIVRMMAAMMQHPHVENEFLDEGTSSTQVQPGAQDAMMPRLLTETQRCSADERVVEIIRKVQSMLQQSRCVAQPESDVQMDSVQREFVDDRAVDIIRMIVNTLQHPRHGEEELPAEEPPSGEHLVGIPPPSRGSADERTVEIIKKMQTMLQHSRREMEGDARTSDHPSGPQRGSVDERTLDIIRMIKNTLQYLKQGETSLVEEASPAQNISDVSAPRRSADESMAEILRMIQSNAQRR